MPDNPKTVEEKYSRYLTALKTLAPDRTFGGVKVPDFATQTEKSDLARKTIMAKNDEIKEAEVERDTEDVVTMKMCEMIKNGVVADPDFGDDSALYEALGFIRKSERRSGLTRKKNGAGGK